MKYVIDQKIALAQMKEDARKDAVRRQAQIIQAEAHLEVVQASCFTGCSPAHVADQDVAQSDLGSLPSDTYGPCSYRVQPSLHHVNKRRTMPGCLRIGENRLLYLFFGIVLRTYVFRSMEWN